MSIIVVCPGCRKSFKVSEKFAGKSGNCPKCKHVIQVPEAQQEVKVHTPEAFASGGKTTSGALVTKPIARQEVKVTPVAAVAIGGSAVVALVIAWIGGKAGLFSSMLTIAPALLLISPALTIAAYTFLRDDELEPYRGRPLAIRAGLCALVYVVLWGVFEYVGRQVGLGPDMLPWLIVVPPFLIVGGLAALATLDFDFGTGVMHYAFYVLVTVILRVTAHIPWPS